MPPTPTTDRRAAQRDALLTLSRLLATAGQGVLQEALDLVLDAVGVVRGVVYEGSVKGLEAVAHRGLPPDLRQSIEHLDGSSAFFAQRAVKQRKTIVEGDVAGASEEIGQALITRSGWTSAVAAPIVVARDVLGAIVIAHPKVEAFTKETVAFIETVANVLALGMSRRRAPDGESPREAKAAQLAATGMLAVGFADDLREPLGALSVQLQEQARLVREMRDRTGDIADFEVLDDLVSEARAAVTRAERTRERLLGAVRDTTPEPISLSAAARDAVALVTPQLRARAIQIEPRFEGEPIVVGRREQLTQIFLQLLLNAAEAIGDTVGASSAPMSRPKRILVRVRHEGSRAIATVEDTGPGVGTELRGKVFDAFFTTKTENLGLGLTLARQIAATHRGHVDIGVSELGGAMFRVTLPAQRAAMKPRSNRATTLRQPAVRPQTNARPAVVWIDDDGLFLRSVKRVLKGWDVRCVRSAGEAEAVLDSASPPLRVFCDVGLPDRSGHDLHRDVSVRSPELASRFVFVTGGAITAEVADYLVASGCPTLLKPIRIDEVETLLERAATTRPPDPRTADTRPPARGRATPHTKPVIRVRRPSRVDAEAMPLVTKKPTDAARRANTVPSVPMAKKRD